jgi:hypothetical protein
MRSRHDRATQGEVYVDKEGQRDQHPEGDAPRHALPICIWLASSTRAEMDKLSECQVNGERGGWLGPTTAQCAGAMQRMLWLCYITPEPPDRPADLVYSPSVLPHSPSNCLAASSVCTITSHSFLGLVLLFFFVSLLAFVLSWPSQKRTTHRQQD